MLIIKAFCILQAIFAYGTEEVLNFHDVNYNGISADLYDWSKHPCKRTCRNDEPPKTCNYVFVVEELSSMSKACYNCPLNITDCSRPHCMPTDGSQKKLVVVNRQLPGPTIEVCQNDMVVVDVRNRMESQSTTVHWHGIDQEGTPYMDGVPHVTQCPILPGDSFTYVFNVTLSGTYFWHSHMGHQRLDSHCGMLIVYSASKDNPHTNLYDEDKHRMIITDWLDESGDDYHIRDFHYQFSPLNGTFLINGLGPTKPFAKGNGSFAFTPYAVFKVHKGKKYRFRLINAGSGNCPVSMSIDNHTMKVISLDSNDIEPVVVDAITSWPGERVDFVLKANQISGNYWIRYRGFGQCRTNASIGVFQGAVLRYANVVASTPSGPLAYDLPVRTRTYRVLNPYNIGTESSQKVNVSIPYLNILVKDDVTLKKVADQQIYISFDFYRINNFDYHHAGLYGYNQVPDENRIGTQQLNHISLRMQPFPLLSQWQQLRPYMLCNSSTIDLKYCTAEACACTHVINVKLNSVVELVFVDEGKILTINHPLHLHGHSFRVVAEENLEGPVTVDRIKQLDRAGKIKRRLKKAPLKDTMKTPGGGYSIVRFRANNPGYWFFHCHFEDHLRIGMALVFKVGEHEDFPKVPNNYPKCGISIPYESHDKSSQAVLNFNNVNYNGVSADRYDWSKHPCKRTCREKDPPRECKYVFVVEELSSMSKACYDCPLNVTDCSRPHCIPANGFPRKVVAVNRLIPGPTIEVCVNDTIIVDMRNRMASQSTAIHWHGIEQKHSPYMDGVPYVTQCPIPPGNSFLYVFNAVRPGTFFWHSHMDQQRHDGLFGNLIVNAIPRKNPHSKLYDVDEHRMIVTDWLDEAGEDNYIRDFHYQSLTFNTTFLINGLGPTKPFAKGNGTFAFTPYAVFKVDKGKRYRYRLINAGSGNCPVQISIDNHTLTVISLDSHDIKPVIVNAITSWPGERYDFVVNANQTTGNYWIRYRGYAARSRRNATNGVFQGAILRYAGATVSNPSATLIYELQTPKNYRELNPYNTGTESSQNVNVSIPYLDALVEDDASLKKVADHQIYLSFDFHRINNFDYHRKGLYGYNQVAPEKAIGSMQLNHISLKLQQFPLLSQWEQIQPSMLCNSSTVDLKVCVENECSCTHVINVKLGTVVELFFVDEGALATINHPLHLHGNVFRVVAEENLEGNVTISRVKQLDEDGKIKRRLSKAPLKDTMKTPGGGYSIVRFLANNPGYWFFHCHFEQHLHEDWHGSGFQGR